MENISRGVVILSTLIISRDVLLANTNLSPIQLKMKSIFQYQLKNILSLGTSGIQTQVCHYLHAVECVQVRDDHMPVLHLPPSVFDGEVADWMVSRQLLNLLYCEVCLHLPDHCVGLGCHLLDQLHGIIC